MDAKNKEAARKLQIFGKRLRAGIRERFRYSPSHREEVQRIVKQQFDSEQEERAKDEPNPQTSKVEQTSESKMHRQKNKS
jgi:hypothetical protein